MWSVVQCSAVVCSVYASQGDFVEFVLCHGIVLEVNPARHSYLSGDVSFVNAVSHPV